MKIAFIMLAAGNSRRFGENKLLHIVEGKKMYEHTLERLCDVQKCMKIYYPDCEVQVIVITQYEEIAQAGKHAGAEVFYNRYPEKGISFSMKMGLEGQRDADACLFTVSDQPWMKRDTIFKLVSFYVSSLKGIVCTAYEGKLGNPCIFSKKYYEELWHLTGDTGGKAIIRKHMDDTGILEVEDEQELEDIDFK